MFKYNINVNQSISKGKNIFLNDINPDKQSCFDNCMFVDIHPLYGLYENISYIWSHGFYLMNPYHFHSFINVDVLSCSEDSFPIEHKNNYISFFITSSSLEYINDEDVLNISNDIEYIRGKYPNKKLKYLTYIESEVLIELLHGLDVLRVYDYKHFFNCAFVVTNMYSTIFMLAYRFKKYVMLITKNDNDYLSSFFMNNLENDNDLVCKRIYYFSNYINNFSINSINDIQYIYNPIVKNFLNIEFEYMKKAINKYKSYNHVYLHSDCGMYFQLLNNAVSKSTMRITNKHQKDTLVCIIMSEINLSKRLVHYVTNIIAFDINPCINLTKLCKTKYFRYYYSKFNTPILLQNNNIDHFEFNSTINIKKDGIIFCCLDNSNGLFYSTPKEWLDTWISMLDFIKDHYKNKIYIKCHPNDVDNIMMIKIINRYENKIHITNKSLEDLKTKIYFCVINHGSLYFRCMQLGCLLLSAKHDISRCKYNLYHLNINDNIMDYHETRYNKFILVLNELVSYENLISGRFFSDLHVYSSNIGPLEIEKPNSEYCVVDSSDVCAKISW